MDDLARIFFPDNRNHRRAFVAVWVEIKYAEHQFLPDMVPLETRYELSRRTVETVRAKLKKLGLIKRISHFNPEFGYRSGWTFSGRFRQALGALAKGLQTVETAANGTANEQKDRDAIHYV